jgi:hypothetical protein
MEELLLLGAGAVAVLVVAPIVGAAVNPELGKSISDSGRDLIKGGLKFGMETTEKLQSSFAEAAILILKTKEDKVLYVNKRTSV